MSQDHQQYLGAIHMRYVIKRTGEKVPFDQAKIRIAITKAGKATKEFDETESERLTRIIVAQIPDDIATVEQLQDLVEQTLMESRITRRPKPISSTASSTES